MSDASRPSEQTKPPFPWWTWTKRVSGCLVLLLFTCCGSLCGGGWWLTSAVRNANKEEVDRLFTEGLHKGDLDAAYEGADPSFRERYSLEEYRLFVEAHPGLFERDNLWGIDFARIVHEGATYLKVACRPGGFFSTETLLLVFKVLANGVLGLVGISPGMHDGLPELLHYHEPSSGGFDFD